MSIEIRAAQPHDAPAISRVIVDALRISNARDYSPEVIQRVESNFTAERIGKLIETRLVLAALQDQQVLGTASLDGQVIRTVFVDPTQQGKGIGRRLMEAIERLAQERGARELLVPSSLTAQGFYRQLGFTQIREVVEGEERTLIMSRQLPA
ncbi:GNAT family N-acetyltransferase [Pseudomonas berkeleyensis]|uniref:GNAT family N-acetyltransferase n=1 Tax=Pseudomonas berkeleyensis TaxID=2726956 RepID=A0A7G5DK24_9PSED|nr:GNAT family N-acetyltransferase [Pseudomonas berkeleyensis]QMV62099.1 GNAT family N-acetyltransferase [Pseudomonas berkeleyensis]WSO37540.1 GNAT family N-acetyltransferase [Pseudomonas berkeleyensis]